MGYAKCIGRVGALAVALGVGAALATAPAIGYAAPADSGGSTSVGSSSPAGDSPSTGAPSSPGGTEAPGTSDGASTPTLGNDGAPAVTVGGSGDSQTSAATEDDDDPDIVAGEEDGDADTDADADADTDEVAGGTDTGSQYGSGSADGDEAPGAPGPAPEPNATQVSGGRGGSDGNEAADEPPAAAPDVDTAAAVEAPADVAARPAAVAHSANVAAQPLSSGGTAARTAAAQVTDSPAPAEVSALVWPVSALTDVAGTVFTLASSIVTAALGPLAPVPGTLSPALWAVLGFARRELGDITQDLSGVIPNAVAQLATVQTIDPPNPFDPGSWVTFIVNVVLEAGEFLRNTLVPIFMNRTPVSTPQQVILTLDPGETSDPIAFTAFDPDGNRMTFTVNERGAPGAATRGTVAINQETGEFTYTPDADFTQGIDTFTVMVEDDTDFHLHSLDFIFGTFSGHRDVATVTVFLNGAPTDTISGEFSLLTYNIADLPEPLSSARSPRSVFTREISTLLNDYDVVHVQEDFAYHSDLIANSLFPSLSAPLIPPLLWPIGVPFADGINTLSAFKVTTLDRQAWNVCTAAGANCLTPKGFSFSRMQLPGGGTVDLYNLHADTDATVAARDNLPQLSNFIQQNSAGRAVIITGDFNTTYAAENAAISKFRDENGLTDAWLQLPPCGPGQCEEIDKIFYRSATGANPGDPEDPTRPVILNAVEYRNERSKFVNDQDQALSDSPPIMVRFTYTVRNLTAP